MSSVPPGEGDVPPAPEPATDPRPANNASQNTATPNEPAQTPAEVTDSSIGSNNGSDTEPTPPPDRPSGGPSTVALAEKTKAVPDVDHILEARKDRRLARKFLSIGLGFFSITFLAAVLWNICTSLSPDVLAIISRSNSHAGFFLYFSIGIMATIAISLMLALVKISSEPESKEAKEPAVGTAISEAIRAIVEAIKTIKN